MKDLLDVFKALSDETRLRIIKLLEGGELCVCDIVAALGMVQPKVSHAPHSEHNNAWDNTSDSLTCPRPMAFIIRWGSRL